jgi:hypothetical protein
LDLDLAIKDIRRLVVQPIGVSIDDLDIMFIPRDARLWVRYVKHGLFIRRDRSIRRRDRFICLAGTRSSDRKSSSGR